MDEYAGKDYSHRKDWVLERLKQLTRVFAIDVCAYAVMSNHYHLVLHVDVERADRWTEEETMEHWALLFRLPALIERYRSGEAISKAQQRVAQQLIAQWKARLRDVSWFMRAMNEHLARRANEEDQCKGRFWEGRFKSQALLDEAGLLTAMAYVDLNPLRAGIANTPEASEFTSIYARIRQLRAAKPDSQQRSSTPERVEVRLLCFREHRSERTPALPFARSDYLQLLDWTGRAIRSDKRGHIDPALPAILTRLNIDSVAWRQAMQPNGNTLFGRALGRLDHLRVHAERLKQSWIRGQRRCARFYG